MILLLLFSFIPMYTLSGFNISPPPYNAFPLSSINIFYIFQSQISHSCRIFLIFPISFTNIFPLILLHSSSHFILLTYFIPPHFVSFTSLFSCLPAVFFLLLVQQILSAMFRPWFCTISSIVPVLPFF